MNERRPQGSGMKSAKEKKQGTISNLISQAKHHQIPSNGHGHASHIDIAKLLGTTRPSPPGHVVEKSETSDIVADPNYDRRKRRRTESPSTIGDIENPGSWEEQLKDAASGNRINDTQAGTPFASRGPAKPDCEQSLGDESDRKQEDTLQEDFEPKENTSGPVPAGSNTSEKAQLATQQLSKQIRVRKDGKLISPKAKPVKVQGPLKLASKAAERSLSQAVSPTVLAKDENQGASDAHHGSTEFDLPKMPTENSAQIKRITARRDGRLVSPKAADDGDIIQGKKKRQRKKGSTIPEKIVVLRYASGGEDGKAISQKIQQILSASQELTTVSLSFEKQSPKKKAQPSPQKPVHPFFKKGSASATDSTSQGQQAPKPIDAPRLSFATPISPAKAAKLSRIASTTSWSNFVPLASARALYRDADTTLLRVPDARDALWPPKGMIHVRGPASDIPPAINRESRLDASSRQSKSKSSEVRVAEDVLFPVRYQVRQAISELPSCPKEPVLKPTKILMTALELQRAIRNRLSARVPRNYDKLSGDLDDGDPLAFSDATMQNHPSCHSAIDLLFTRLGSAVSAFDDFRCESQDWNQKYSPSSAMQVLQHGRDVMYLRDWLYGLVVNTVDDGKKDATKMSSTSKIGRPKKRRKKAEELDGFVVSSEEEANEMDELTEPEELTANNSENVAIKRTVIRIGDRPGQGKAGETHVKSTNAVVISGPHGCGKTAAVYAIAKELGFEVFEISPGSRRSGKDILEKIGDMTRNHLVQHQVSEAGLGETPAEVSEKLEPEVRQGTLQGFFKQKGTATKPSKAKQKANNPPTEKPKDAPKPKTKSQKQSLLLLEEVDILFEEDRGFWQSVLELIQKSKRPIIMTCTDESRLPLDDMALHAIFRMQTPPETLAVDYLLLLASNEGHLLSREAVQDLYCSLMHDLRASIATLDFWCQMAIGDEKGGLDWMPIPSAKESYKTETGDRRRVISEGTYYNHLAFNTATEKGSTSVAQAEDGKFTLAEHTPLDTILAQEMAGGGTRFTLTGCRHEKYSNLVVADLLYDAMSCEDLLAVSSGRQDEFKTTLDTSKPPMTEKQRIEYISGIPLLNADPLKDWRDSATTSNISLAPQLLNLSKNQRVLPQASTIGMANGKAIASQGHVHDRLPKISRASLCLALSPLTDQPKLSFIGNTKGPQINTLDGTLGPIVEDVAPYVRSTVAYDIRLEEQRTRLNSLMSERGLGGKRQRTTRASRAALEGGNKANTRRERWFPKTLNFASVLQTGGEGWAFSTSNGDEAPPLPTSSMGSQTESRRSSVASLASLDTKSPM
ncbi:hypothetical protein MMC25_007693 [Agyrium rufum]|nr:hypothetical protein [Agyrium rufum]